MKLKSLQTHNEEVSLIWQKSQEAIKKTGIECPNCVGVELIRQDPFSILACYPPKFTASCPNCKEIQYISI